MANEEHVEILRQGIDVWNKWQSSNSAVMPTLVEQGICGADLSGANLSDMNLEQINLFKVDLSGARLGMANLANAAFGYAKLTKASVVMAYLNSSDLRWTDLRKVDFWKASLVDADLSEADLREANLTQANLHAAIFRKANLSQANLRDASLTETNFSEAELKGADFTNARVKNANFDAVDLREVKGLEKVKHLGPSSIGIDTIYLSQGQIPEIFLRGAGVSDSFITYMRSLTGQTIQFYSCFISYSSKDQSFAERLHNDLQANGVRCWFAPEDMKIGDKMRSTIDHSIRLHDKLLVVLSENSINSNWVETEVETALEEEKSRHGGRKTVLFPIRLDGTVMETDQAWAATIRRQRHIGDFTRWKEHDSYQTAFDRLLRDLRAGNS